MFHELRWHRGSGTVACMSVGLPEPLAALLFPGAYPHAVEAIELIQTHVSWVLLAGEFAYKIKRPVAFAFVDLRALERRAFFCREELRLNRRFAPQLYLDVCPITLTGGAARIGGCGEPVEYAVKMRRFQREDELDNLLVQQRIVPAELESFGWELASIHAGLPVAEPSATWGDPQHVSSALLRNLQECSQASTTFGRAAEVVALRPELERELEVAAPWMAQRKANHRVRACHGDLHAANVVRLESRLVAFDCMEFEPAFRWIDVSEEVAFLLADLEAQGYPQYAQAFLGGYLAASGDYQACRVLQLYKAHRALLRELARRLGVTPCLIQCRAPHDVLAARIVERQARGRDASEADVRVLDWQKEHWEPVGPDEQWPVVAVETAQVDVSDLVSRIAALQA
jgi:uncharacterized protein